MFSLTSNLDVLGILEAWFPVGGRHVVKSKTGEKTKEKTKERKERQNAGKGFK